LSPHARRTPEHSREPGATQQGTGADLIGRQPQEALRQSEERFRLLVESVTEYAIFELDTEGRILTWNAGAQRINGYRAEEIIGKHFSIFYLPEDVRQGRPQRGLEEAAARGRYKDEGWCVRKDGSRFWAEVVIAPVRDKAGNLLGFAKVTRDLTDRKRSEEEIARAEEQLKALVEERTAELAKANEKLQAEIHMPRRFDELVLLQLVLDRSPVGCVMNDTDFRVIYWNPAAEQIFGFSQEEALGKLPYETFVPPRAKAYVESVRERTASGDTGANGASECVTKDGRTIFCEWYNTPLKDSAGTFIGYLSVLQDVTERKRSEEQSRATSEQLRALAARLQSVREDERTYVAREIHDELGQACTALKMDLALLVQQLPKSRRRPHERARSMFKLIDDMIHSLRRIASELRPSTLDDLGLLAAIELQAQEFENRSGIKCHLALPQTEIALDSHRSTAIFRIFQETLTNVARHANATRVNVRLVGDAESVTLEVTDNGKGIDEIRASAHNSLGLLGMRERALLLGGEFSIRGSPGQGTAVTVRVPVADRQRTGEPRSPSSAG